MELVLISLLMAFVIVAASSAWLELLAKTRSGLRLLELGTLITLIVVLVVLASLRLLKV